MANPIPTFIETYNTPIIRIIYNISGSIVVVHVFTSLADLLIENKFINPNINYIDKLFIDIFSHLYHKYSDLKDDLNCKIFTAFRYVKKPITKSRYLGQKKLCRLNRHLYSCTTTYLQLFHATIT